MCDYFNSNLLNFTGCCPEGWTQCRRANTNTSDAHLPSLLQVFGMIFSMLLCCAIRKSREVVWHPLSHPWNLYKCCMMSFLESHDSPLPIETLLVQGWWPKRGWVQIFLIIKLYISYNCAADTWAQLPEPYRCDVVTWPNYRMGVICAPVTM